MRYEDTRSKLIIEGSRLMSRKGYHGVGLKEILDTTGVPKGSFYHYFKSKEAFAIEMINYNMDLKVEMMSCYLRQTDYSPLERLKNFLNHVLEEYSEATDDDSLIIKMVTEMANLSPPIKTALETGSNRLKNILQSCLNEGQQIGEISSDHTIDELTEFLFTTWEGAIIRSRLIGSDEPLKIFIHYLFNKILK